MVTGSMGIRNLLITMTLRMDHNDPNNRGSNDDDRGEKTREKKEGEKKREG